MFMLSGSLDNRNEKGRSQAKFIIIIA